MIRHPFYILFCLFAVGYLAVADTRGLSVFHTLSRTIAGGARSGSHGFNHK